MFDQNQQQRVYMPSTEESNSFTENFHPLIHVRRKRRKLKPLIYSCENKKAESNQQWRGSADRETIG